MARDLSARVNAGVGAAGHGQDDVPASDACERLLQCSLHRPVPGLSGPAGELRTVVLQEQSRGQGYPRLRATINA